MPDRALPDRALPDLTALGLPGAPARVLAVVVDEGWTDAAVVAARAGLSRPQVSAALDVLAELGLVTRERGGRPARVHSTAEAADVADDLARRAADAAVETARAAEAAARAVREAAQRNRVPEPAVRRLEPSLAGDGWLLGLPRTSYDAVAAADSPQVRFGQHFTRTWVARRLIVTGEVPTDARDAGPGAGLGGGIADAQARGVHVRRSAEDLPALVVVDGDRAAVDVGVRARGGRRGWTTDAAQVRALRQLFELWWEVAADG